MKNQGISLISLIITIIVIIILAAIVIFTGLDTPDAANFAKFCSSVDDMYSATLNQYSLLKTRYSVSGETKNDEQIYGEIALGQVFSQYDAMSKDNTITDGDASNTLVPGDHCQRFNQTTNYLTTKAKFQLPKVRENDCAWYVTEDGKIFNATGYVYDNKTYFNASTFVEGKLDVVKDNQYNTRAEAIATALVNGTALTAGTLPGAEA